MTLDIIKCYANRKMYSLKLCRYVYFTDLRDRLKAGITLKFITHDTEVDVTRDKLINMYEYCRRNEMATLSNDEIINRIKGTSGPVAGPRTLYQKFLRKEVEAGTITEEVFNESLREEASLDPIAKRS